MNIKSLLLGSAAALAAVSGARAADAVVIAEPEPVEYVRVCDAYGTGFFYIPGTETCIRIGGEVRYQVTANSTGAPGVIDPVTGLPISINLDTTPYQGAIGLDGWSKHSRGRFFIDTRESTEWGTLRGYIRVDASRNDGANGINTNKAWLSIGDTHQIKIGWEDSAWAFTPNNGGLGYGSGTDNGLYYGYQQRHMMQYHYYGPNGWFASLSLEHDGQSGDGYVPDVVARAGVYQGWGGVLGLVGYDESFDGFGAQVAVRLNVPSFPGSYFIVRGFYADGDHAYSTGAPGWAPVGQTNILGSGEWSVMAAYYHQINAQWSATVGAQYFSDLYFAGSDVSSDVDAWALDAGVVWTPVQNFAIRAEVNYNKVDIDDVDGTVSGFLRFSRFF